MKVLLSVVAAVAGHFAFAGPGLVVDDGFAGQRAIPIIGLERQAEFVVHSRYYLLFCRQNGDHLKGRFSIDSNGEGLGGERGHLLYGGILDIGTAPTSYQLLTEWKYRVRY